jgi:hypothetical protein
VQAGRRGKERKYPLFKYFVDKTPRQCEFHRDGTRGTARDRSPVARIHRPVNLPSPAAVDGAESLKMDFHDPGTRQIGATAIQRIALAGGIAYSFLLPKQQIEQRWNSSAFAAHAPIT